MNLSSRPMRAAASALLVAVSVGAGGMTAASATLAADSPPLPYLTGTLATASGTSLQGIELIVEEESADGGLTGYQVTTDATGSFGVDLEPWGTAESPATLRIRTAEGQEATFDDPDGCSRTWSVAAADERPIAAADPAPLAPVALVAEMTLVGEACDTSSSQPPADSDDPGASVEPTRTPSGAVLGATGRPRVTPPPTDLELDGSPQPDRLGAALTIGFVLGLVAALVILRPRPGARRRS